jgi:hypothetical protein
VPLPTAPESARQPTDVPTAPVQGTPGHVSPAPTPSPAQVPAPPVAAPADPAPALPPTPPPLPPAGPVPFGVGEVALYEVSWVGFGAGLSAGTAEFSVRSPRDDDSAAWRIELVAQTASWVSAFFDARDVFWSEATPDLLPLQHRQELREGRRRSNRTIRFDREAHVARVGSGALTSPSEGVFFPCPPLTRDPLSAMYFARTLTMPPGSLTRLPVTDLGHALIVDIRAGGYERIDAEGHTQDAQRLVVRMAYVSDTYPTPEATLWLSRDARRVPLMAEVKMDVGLFRMTLTEYTAPPQRGGRVIRPR